MASTLKTGNTLRVTVTSLILERITIMIDLSYLEGIFCNTTQKNRTEAVWEAALSEVFNYNVGDLLHQVALTKAIVENMERKSTNVVLCEITLVRCIAEAMETKDI